MGFGPLISSVKSPAWSRLTLTTEQNRLQSLWYTGSQGSSSLKGDNCQSELRLRKFSGRPLFPFGVGGDFGGDVFQCELADEVAGGVVGGAQEGVVDGENDAAIFFGSIEVGDTPGGEVTEDVGVVELAAATVAAAEECGGEGVPGPRADASGALIEVAWILTEEGGEDGRAEHAADEEVAVVGCIALGVACGALAVVRVGVARLLDAGERAGGEEGDRINGRTKGEAEFLFGLERCGVPDEAGVEVREDSKDALVHLGVDLFLGDLLFGDGDLNVYGGCGDGKSDYRELAVFSGVDSELVRFVWFEVERGDPDLEGSGWQVFERERAGAVSYFDALSQTALIFKGDFGAGDDTSVDVEDVSSDAGGGLRGQRLWGGGLPTGGVGQVRLAGCGIGCLPRGYLLREEGRGETQEGEAQEKDAQDETAEVSGPGETSVFPILIPHLETPVRDCFFFDGCSRRLSSG